METVKENTQIGKPDDFLLTQFTALGNHIVGLFNAGTQRIAAYLMFVGLIFTVLSLSQSHPEKNLICLGTLLSSGFIGFFIWHRTFYQLFDPGLAIVELILSI